MDIDYYWWLLALPLFFALGWLAARIDIKHLVVESRALPTSYFKGLNFLLNEQPDKAIEAFETMDRFGGSPSRQAATSVNTVQASKQGDVEERLLQPSADASRLSPRRGSRDSSAAAIASP